MTILQAVAASLAEYGLMLRGGFPLQADDGVPVLSDGRPARSVLLVGNAGPALWRAFAAGRAKTAGEVEPLDAWCRHAIGTVAARHGAACLFPSDGPPWWPFQRWAQRAEPVFPSPLGLLIHPRYGLWHAWRGALLFAEALDLPGPGTAEHPCESCRERPCLRACPVGAFAPAGYDVEACAGHAGGPEGAACRDGGCLARHACPVGRDFAYGPEQAAFHMAAFLRRRPGGDPA